MKALSKGISVFLSLANYAAGITVAFILILKKDFISIFYINGMTSNESLFFNQFLFQAVLAITGIVLCLLLNEYKKSEKELAFPLIYEIPAIVIAIIDIVFAVAGETVREKVLGVIFALTYALISAVIIYFSTKAFTLYDEAKKDG